MDDITSAIFSSVAETSLAGVLLVQQGQTVYVNRAMASMVGRDTAELGEADEPLIFVHPQDRAGVEEYLRKRQQGAEGEVHMAVRLIHRDGAVLHAQLRGQAVDYRGEPAMVILVLDFSEQRAFLGRLEQSEQKYRSIVEQSEDGIVLMDEEGAIVEWNHAQEEITGYRCSDVLGKPVWDVMVSSFPEEHRSPATCDTFRQMIESFLASGDAPWLRDLIEQEIERPDGERRIIQGRYFAVPTAQGYMCANFARDITARRAMEEELRAHRRRLQSLASQLNRAEERERRRIATDLHDQIGQTLAVANMKLGALRRELGRGDAGDALSSVQQLIGQAIEGTRTLTFELAPPMLYELGLGPALEWLAERVEQQHSLPVEVSWDETTERPQEEIEVCLFRCVTELLNNVVRHAEATRATVSFSSDGARVRVVVEDDGQGAPPSTRGEPQKERQGFGLFNVREQIQQLAGQFEISAQSGEGTRVTLAVPAKPR